MKTLVNQSDSGLRQVLSNIYFPTFVFSVLTPYYEEAVLYSEEELNKENEDGISILFYLQRIYPGEFLYDAFVRLL